MSSEPMILQFENPSHVMLRKQASGRAIRGHCHEPQPPVFCPCILSLSPFISCLFLSLCFYFLFPFSIIKYYVLTMCLALGRMPSLLCPFVVGSPHFSRLFRYPAPHTPNCKGKTSSSKKAFSHLSFLFFFFSPKLFQSHHLPSRIQMFQKHLGSLSKVTMMLLWKY